MFGIWKRRIGEREELRTRKEKDQQQQQQQDTDGGGFEPREAVRWMREGASPPG